ncbi:MAG: transglutaminase-like domain-containing protein [Candidatus Caldarchaeum sp.]
MLALAMNAVTLAMVSPAANPLTIPSHPERSLDVQFFYTASISSIPKGTKRLRLWIPVPSSSEWQAVGSIQVQSDLPYHITKEKQYRNRMVYLEVENPSKPISVTVRFAVRRKEVLLLASKETLTDSSDPLDKDIFLQPNQLIPVGGLYLSMAREVVGERASPLEQARALYDHIIATMEYDYTKASPKLGMGDVAFVCDYRKGNCSDLHSYFISLARSLGIPATIEYGFPIVGVPVPDNLPQEGTIGGYHCWAWFYVPNYGWLPLDASDARRWQDAKIPAKVDFLFGNLVLERSAVTISKGRDVILEPKQDGPPLNYFVYPYAEMDGKPINPKWEMRFRLLKSP